MSRRYCIQPKKSQIETARNLPVIGLTHEVHLLANNSPKQSPQYGFSSLDVKRCPANEVLQWLHVKHSLCHGSFLYVTPPLVIICDAQTKIDQVHGNRSLQLGRWVRVLS